MSKTLMDILVCLAMAGGLFLTARAFYQNKIRTAVLSVLVLGLILRVYLAQDPYLHHWDERYHALVAKNMMDHPLKPTLFENPVLPFDEDEWIGSHLWFSKPPVPLWSMSASMAVFGVNEFAIRIPSILFGVFAIYITFLLGKRLFNERVGVVAGFLHAIHGLIIETSAGRVSSDHAETFFIIFVELAVYFSVISIQEKKAEKWIVLAGLFTGLAFLSKWFPAFIVFPVWFVGFIFSDQFNWKKLFLHGLLLVGVTALVVYPWIAIINSYGDNILERVLFAFNEPVQGHRQPFYYYWHQIMIIFGELIYLPIGFAVYFVMKKKKKLSNLALLAWILIPLLIFTLGGTKRHTYILIAAPAIFLIVSQLFVFLYDRWKEVDKKWLGAIVMLALIALPVRYSVERLKLFVPYKEQSEFYQNRIQWEGGFNDNTVVVGCPENIELMFHSNVVAAYTFIPFKHEIDSIEQAGYEVLYYHEGLIFPDPPTRLDNQ